MNEDKNVYGENHPPEEDAEKAPGVREKVAEEKGTAEDLEETRRKAAEETPKGGMGRESTPQTEAPQGSWSRPEE